MSTPSAITASRIFDGKIWHEDAALVLDDAEVARIMPRADLPAAMAVEQLADGFLVPGFVDLQVNGGGGVLLNNDLTVSGIHTICAAHAKYGTTALLPTLITDTPEVTDAAIAAGIEAAKAGVPGFAGLHLEGPHLSIARKGAHDPALIRPMTDADSDRLIAARAQLPALMTTVAAESVTPAQVRALVDAGIKVSIGHCDAGYDDVRALADAGATMITHLFNAMSQFTGREPGMVGAALNTGSLNVGLIADGFHVHPEAMALAIRAKQGPGRIFLVTDAMSSIGTDMTEFMLNGRRILRAGGKLTLEDGTLAGADLDMATAIRVLHTKVGIDLDETLRMATLYPAETIGRTGAGILAPQSRADFVWLSEGLEARRTWIAGQPL